MNVKYVGNLAGNVLVGAIVGIVIATTMFWVGGIPFLALEMNNIIELNWTQILIAQAVVQSLFTMIGMFAGFIVGVDD